MTDKEKIRAEIENKLLRIEVSSIRSSQMEGAEIALKSLCDFINSLPEEPVTIDFEQELYNKFGQVRDFTLGMRIAKYFYKMGNGHQER